MPVVENILSANDRLAEDNRQRLEEAGVYGINLMASPGAGKTSLIEHTVKALAGQLSLAVVDGDIATSIDADRAAGRMSPGRSHAARSSQPAGIEPLRSAAG